MIKEYLRKYTVKSTWFEHLWIRLQWIVVNHNARRYSDIEYANRLWKAHNGKGFINISNPKTYDEKMWYLKLSNRDPLLTICSDKHEVRNYVNQCGFPEILKKEIGTYTNADQIDFSQLPDKVYLKCNNGSGLNMIFDKSKAYNLRHIRWKFNFLLKQNPYYLSREWNYKEIKPLIVCEEILAMPDGVSDVPEIQFFCFHGIPKFIMYNLGLADANGRHKTALRWVFDMDWKLIPVKTSMPTNDNIPSLPKAFDKMVDIATVLSKPFPHVRIDLFNIEGKIYFNEMTFYSGGGFVKLEPDEWQALVGGWIDCSSYQIAEDAKKKHDIRKERIKNSI